MNINKLLYKLVIIICVFTLNSSLAQGFLVSNARQPHNSSILDLSNNAVGKAFNPPKVNITSLTDIITPVENPVEGLIVYNIGSSNLKGFYIFQNGTWNLLATRESSVTNAVFKRNETSFTISNTYSSASDYTTLFNNSGDDISLSGTTITLKPGKYVVNIMYNITTDETETLSIGNSNGKVHTHFYKGRLWTTSGVALGGEVKVNEISTVFGNKSHNAYFIYSFQITESVSFKVELARNTGGTFTGTNLILKDSYIHIEKSLL